MSNSDDEFLNVNPSRTSSISRISSKPVKHLVYLPRTSSVPVKKLPRTRSSPAKMTSKNHSDKFYDAISVPVKRTPRTRSSPAKMTSKNHSDKFHNAVSRTSSGDIFHNTSSDDDFQNAVSRTSSGDFQNAVSRTSSGDFQNAVSRHPSGDFHNAVSRTSSGNDDFHNAVSRTSSDDFHDAVEHHGRPPRRSPLRVLRDHLSARRRKRGQDIIDAYRRKTTVKNSVVRNYFTKARKHFGNIPDSPKSVDVLQQLTGLLQSVHLPKHVNRLIDVSKYAFTLVQTNMYDTASAYSEAMIAFPEVDESTPQSGGGILGSFKRWFLRGHNASRFAVHFLLKLRKFAWACNARASASRIDELLGLAASVNDANEHDKIILKFLDKHFPTPDHVFSHFRSSHLKQITSDLITPLIVKCQKSAATRQLKKFNDKHVLDVLMCIYVTENTENRTMAHTRFHNLYRLLFGSSQKSIVSKAWDLLWRAVTPSQAPIKDYLETSKKYFPYNTTKNIKINWVDSESLGYLYDEHLQWFYFMAGSPIVQGRVFASQSTATSMKWLSAMVKLVPTVAMLSPLFFLMPSVTTIAPMALIKNYVVSNLGVFMYHRIRQMF